MAMLYRISIKQLSDLTALYPNKSGNGILGSFILPYLSRNELLRVRKFHQPISMAYDHSLSNGRNSPLLIMHGILGNKSNWRSMIKSISPNISRSVYLLDARNHGDSPHTDEFNYDVLAKDVCYFMEKHNLKKACLLGHSLGGRAMMTLALQNPSLVDKLIIVDISPVKVPPGSEKVLEYIRHLLKINLDTLPSINDARKVVEETLTPVCPEKFIRNFLMTNLSINNGKLRWKANLLSIEKNFTSVTRNSSLIEMRKEYIGETHFISGEKSDYIIRTEDYADILAIFPNSQFHVVKDAGHFVHSEQPEGLKEILLPILNS